jgi:TRAP-type C4-dicarboxylate transport system substrate-binding protein
VYLFPTYFKMIEAAAGNKYTLDIKYYPTGALLVSDEIYDGVAAGICDAGMSSFGYTPGRFPVMLTLNQPGVAPPKGADSASAGAWEFYNTFKPKELDYSKLLFINGTGPGYLHSNKPILSVDAMKGLRIRCTGGGVLGVKAVGADPVAMGMSEAYQAAQKGIIDALVSPPETLEGWKHWEVFKYSIPVPEFYSEFFHFTMNWDFYNSLPQDLQDAIDAVQKDIVTEAGALWQYQQQHGIDFAEAQPGGHQFLELPPEEAAKLKEAVKPVRDEYVAMLNGKGFPGDEIADTAGEIMEKYNKMTYKAWQPPK